MACATVSARGAGGHRGDYRGQPARRFGSVRGPCDADVDQMASVTYRPMVGEFDECACTCLGAIYDCGCEDIIEGDCDCDGNQLDALGVRRSCDADVDSDGICDDEDPCVGELTPVACATARRDLRVRL